MSTHTHVSTRHYGWQQAALPLAKKVHRMVCHHFGTLIASNQMDRHPVGHQWVCSCGQGFVVAMRHGKKALVKETVS